jgi:stage III sporulation protein AC
MEIELVLKAAGIGMIIAVVCQILSKAGRDEQSTMVSLVGMVVIFMLLANRIGEIIKILKDVFSL